MSKKDLIYTSFEELQQKTTFDFNTLDFNKPSICNSLLKLYDEGNKNLNNGDDEKAFMLWMRFFEGVIKLRKSKIYKQDKSYVDNFITAEKLNRTLTFLEKLKNELKTRYQEQTQKLEKISQESIDKDKTSDLNNLPDSLQEIKINTIDKKFITPKELIEQIRKSVLKILIIDTRSKVEFDSSHMDLNILLSDEIKKKNLVSYVNIPNDLIQNVSWNIFESLKSNDKLTADIFSSRAQFDYIILFDLDSNSSNIKTGSKISILKRAIYDYDIENKLKNEPIVLEGGWSEWIIYYPGFKTSLTNGKILISEETKNQSNKKPFDFDYPELQPQIKPNSKQPEIQQQKLNNNQSSSSLTTLSQINDEKKEKNQEETEIKNESEIKNSIKKTNETEINSELVLIPIIDRSKKPNNLAKEESNSNKENKIEQEQTNQINKNDNLNIKPTIVIPNRFEKPVFNKEGNKNNNEIRFNKANIEPPEPPTIVNNSDTKLNDLIFNSVYAPTRFNKPVHTPYMKEGAAKILNTETGLFSYRPSTAPISNEPIVNNIGTSLTNIQKKQIERPKPILEFKKPSSEGSNLKRTLSSPNIANIGDEIVLPEAKFSNENLIKNIIIKNSPENLNQISLPTLPKPVVNRNSKPMPEHVMRSRIEELQPVFGKTHPGLTGIRNLGNTCFMNSILQCLNHTESLVKFFLSGKFKQDLNRQNDLGFRGEIADEFSVIVSSIWGGHCRIISPRRFKFIIGQFNQQFVSNEQQDAQELLLFLLDGLHEDLNRIQSRPKLKDKEDENENLTDVDAANKAWNIHLSINNSIIVDLFQGQFRSTVTCSFCNKKSVKFDAFMYLTLPVPSTKCDIYQSLELFLQPEEMIGESKWNCPKCKKYRDAIKKIDIWKLPPLLIIHLKRFKYQGLWRDKITTNVDYPIDDLNLDKYILKNKKNNNYRLYAISNHSGTMDGGHYTSMCRHFDFDRWFKFDDSEVKEINNLSSLKTPTSYILFYNRF